MVIAAGEKHHSRHRGVLISASVSTIFFLYCFFAVALPAYRIVRKARLPRQGELAIMVAVNHFLNMYG